MLVIYLTYLVYTVRSAYSPDQRKEASFKVERKSTSPTCADGCRDSLKVCLKDIATNDHDKKTCGKIFVKSFAMCSYSDVSKEKEGCVIKVWKMFAKCSTTSKTYGEGFVCRYTKDRHLNDCRGTLSSKRSKSCNDCVGEYQACESTCDNAADFEVCVAAKDACTKDCTR